MVRWSPYGRKASACTGTPTTPWSSPGQLPASCRRMTARSPPSRESVDLWTRGVGDHALLVLVDDARSAAVVRERVLDLAAEAGLPMPRDVVPAARSVLLHGLPGPAAVTAWRSRVEDEPS